MTEDEARQVLLVRALEGAEPSPINAADRHYAGRAALELARWQADQRKAPLAPGDFLAQRARLLVERTAAVQERLARALQALRWPQALAVALPLLAFVVGALSEQAADRSRVNLLALPLLAIVAWNLVVYGLLAGHALGIGRTPAARLVAGLGDWLGWRAVRVAGRGHGAALLTGFATDWSARSAPLNGARLAGSLHLAAALFALGAVFALYLRGLVFEYRVGWESTFLEAGTVQALLATLLAPAAAVTGLALPTLEEVQALRFRSGAAGGAAARWIHLYAATLALLVIVPRLLLAAGAAWRARRLAGDFPLDLSEPYFRRLLAGVAAQSLVLRVQPYSYTPEESSIAGLRQLAQRLAGEDVQLEWRPPLAFGNEDDAPLAATAAALTCVLTSLATTPEHENHGALLARLRAAGSRAPLWVVDAAPYRRRLGAAGAARLEERRNAWLAFAQAHGAALAVLDLEQAEPAAFEAAAATLAPAMS